MEFEPPEVSKLHKKDKIERREKVQGTYAVRASLYQTCSLYGSINELSSSMDLKVTQKMSKMSCTETNLIKYDVFLSFRGLDTRRNLTSFLYKELIGKSIRTFKDDKELESGSRISSELVRAIEDSSVAVVVVSENYSSSTHCLDELVKIMDCADNGSITVMPIFYGVDPAHLRWKTGIVAEHFKKHEAREDHDKVRLWKEALTSLSNTSGDCSEKWEDDSKMVDEITDRIAKTLLVTTTVRSYASDLKEIDVHMEALQQLMDLNSNNGLKLMGIWARGDEGRSALARNVFTRNCQHFESHCFLENDQKTSQDIPLWHPLWHLRQRIPILKNKKVLLVADDVNTLGQLDALAPDFNTFGPGSVVIITTKDKKLLESFNVNLVYEAELVGFHDRALIRLTAFTRRNGSEPVLDRAFTRTNEFEPVLDMNLAMEWLSYY